MPGFLQVALHHDLHQASNMQAGRGTIVTDISRDFLPRGQRVQGIQIGALVHKTTLYQCADELGLDGGHDIKFQLNRDPGTGGVV